jgi:hypothetical protein
MVGRMRPLRICLYVIGVSQFLLGVGFLLVPGAIEGLFNLGPAAPPWADWLVAMLGARFLGYSAGMVIAARRPARQLAWINTMIGIQVVDWVATLGFLISGELRLAQVGVAAVLPVLFVAALLWWHPRRTAVEAATDA